MRRSADNGPVDAVVIGSGVAGLTTALRLAEQGLRVTVVDQASHPGGKAAEIGCQATDRCLKCGACYAVRLVRDVSAHPEVELRTQTKADRCRDSSDGFLLTLVRQRLWVDPSLCTGCGLCARACPAAPNPAIHPAGCEASAAFAIDVALCLRSLGGDCRECAAACPAGAVELEPDDVIEEMHTGVVIFAGGYEPYDPSRRGLYQHGRVRNLVSADDLERALLESGTLMRPSDRQAPRRIAFIHCVGSRDRRSNLNCSRVCCGYATRLMLLAHKLHPGAHLTRFYIDLQPFGRDWERVYAEAASCVRDIRSLPVDMQETDGEDVLVSYEDRETGSVCRESFDLVVLCSGLTGTGLDREEAQDLLLSLDGAGFCDQARLLPGVFTCGSCVHPMTIEESVCQGNATACQVAGHYAQTRGEA